MAPHLNTWGTMFAVLALSILIGVSLGLLGGGGSILTVPILRYVAGMDAAAAITSSLFVVAVTSAAGVISHARAGRVRWRTGVIFGAAGMAGAYAGGHVSDGIPARVLMVLFGAMMVATGLAMLRKRRDAAAKHTDLPIAKVLVQGAAVGMVTGVIGAGGGFLVVPALVLFGGLAMENAVATSLLVISMQALAGFVGHIDHVAVAWPTTLAVTGVAVAGSFLGAALAGRVPPASLRRGFGIFILVIAVVVLAKELL